MSIIKSIARSSNGVGTITLEVDPDQMTGVVNGCLWFGVTDGKPQFLSRLNPIPDPIDDAEMLPFSGCGQLLKIVNFSTKTPWSPTFDIQHLCGYNYTPANYKSEASKLESLGFFPMRSKRGRDGKYWEVWRLMGYWSAEGALKKFIGQLDQNMGDEAKLETVVHWLCGNCSFGTLDVTAQRAAMCLD